MSKHWKVLMVCCGLTAASIGLSINASGVFYTPVSESLNIGRGDFAMHMTIFSLVTAISALFVPKIMEKMEYKKLLTLNVMIAVISTAIMAICRHLIVFYILGAIRGVSTGMFSIVPITIIMNHWFEEKHGLATSIVFSCSGLAGSIFSPILTNCIEMWGWQIGYVIKALLILLLCLPAMLYSFYVDPQDEGLLPYGFKESKKVKDENTKKHFSFLTIGFISFFAFSLLCSFITSVTQHLPGYGETLGYSAQISSMLLSASMIGNILSKLVMGVLSDKMGAIKATFVMSLCNILGILFLMNGSFAGMLILGALLFGSCYAIGAVALPLLTKYLMGINNYAFVFPKISFASNEGSAISISLVGYIYDVFGSYMYAFVFALVFIILYLILLWIATKYYQRKLKLH